MNVRSRWMVKLSVVALLVGAATVSMRGQWAPKAGEWPTYEDSLRTWSAPQWWSDRHEKDSTLPMIKGKAA